MKKKHLYQTIFQVFLSFWASYALFQSIQLYSHQWFILFLLLMSPALIIQQQKIKEHNQNEIFNFIKYIYFFLGEDSQKRMIGRSTEKHLADILHLYYLYDYLQNNGTFQAYWTKINKNNIIIFNKEIIFYVKYFHKQYRKLMLDEYEKEKELFMYNISNNDEFKGLNNFFILAENEINKGQLLEKLDLILERSTEEEINQPAEHIKYFIEKYLIHKKI